MTNFGLFQTDWDLLPGVNVGAALAGSPMPQNLDPNGWTSTQHVLADNTTRPPAETSGSYTGGYSAPSYDRNVLAQFDQSENMINSSLGRLDGQLGVANSNIDNQYGVKNNELNTQRATNEASYGTSSTQNSQNLRSNKNVITDQASNGLRGLLRTLGAYGAAGSSDMGVAGRAVADTASQQRSGAGQTFAQNQQGLDTNWGNYLGEFGNSQKKLGDWRDEQKRSAESQSLSTRQDLLSRLAEARSQRAALIGGNAAASAQPFLDQATALNGRIDELGRINPSYDGTTPTYNQRALDSYDAGTGTAGVVSNTADGSATPWLSLLLGREKNKSALGL